MSKKNSVRMIAYAAMLVALEVILNRFCSINTNGLKIGFSFVPIVIAANLFGPACAAIVYGTADLLGAILFPIGPYHPGFTLCAALMGLVYGLFLHQKSERRISYFPDIVVPALVNNLVFGLLVNTIWVAMLYSSKAYGGWFLYRLPEYVVLIPMNLILTPPLLRLCEQIRKYMHNKQVKA